jgi:hypothetical protein
MQNSWTQIHWQGNGSTLNVGKILEKLQHWPHLSVMSEFLILPGVYSKQVIFLYDIKKW